MNQDEKEPKLLNRTKNKENNFNSLINEIEKETINSALATQFPQWDLTPPVSLVKRRSTKLK